MTVAALVFALVAPATAASAGSVAAGTSGPGSQLWAARYAGPQHNSYAYSAAVSPDGQTVFVTGQTSSDYATVAYNTTTGAQLWAKRYNNPTSNSDEALSVAVSPDGKTVFITGQSWGVSSEYDYVTIAYNAATGAQQWLRRYNGPGDGYDIATSIAVSPDGSAVFVTGQSQGSNSNYDYATVAYNATTGAQLWAERYNGPADTGSGATSVAVSPSSATVFVTGFSEGKSGANNYATVAYNATTGAQLWVERYGNVNPSDASSLAVSPNGETVFVTGTNDQYGYVTIAYNATTGAQQWVKSYNGPGNGSEAASVAISPDGGTVFVTGRTRLDNGNLEYATVAYNATAGTQLWAKTYMGTVAGNDTGSAVGVSPDGTTVYVTGTSDGATSTDYSTIGYDATTGAQLWVKRYNPPSGSTSSANALTVSPTTGTVFVTGGIQMTNGFNFGTVAYQG